MCIVELAASPPDRPSAQRSSGCFHVCALGPSGVVNSKATSGIPVSLDFEKNNQHAIYNYRSTSFVYSMPIGKSLERIFCSIIAFIYLFLLQNYINSSFAGDEWYVYWRPQLQFPFVGATANATIDYERPTVLTFAVVVDPVRVEGVLEYIDGILAAFNESNSDKTLSDTNLEIKVISILPVIDPMIKDGSFQRRDDKRLKEVFTPFLHKITDPAAALAEYGKTFSGIIDLTDTLLRAYVMVYPDEKDFILITIKSRTAALMDRSDVIFMTTGSSFQRGHLIEVMLHLSRVNCGTVIAFLEEDEEGGTPLEIQRLRSRFLHNGYPEPTIFVRELGQSSYNGTMIRNSLHKFLRSCILFDDTVDVTDTLLKDLVSEKYGEFNLSEYSIFIMSRSVRMGVSVYPPHFKGVYYGQLLPDSTHSTIKPTFISSFNAMRQNALYNMSQYIDPSTVPNRKGGGSAVNPSRASYMGYIFAAFLSKVAFLTVDLKSTKALLDTIYTTSTFRIHNYGLGPFTRECVDGVKGPCSCNVGFKTIDTNYIDPDSLIAKNMVSASSDLEPNVTSLTVSSDSCMSSENIILRRPYVSLFPMGDKSVASGQKQIGSPAKSLAMCFATFASKSSLRNYLHHVKEGFLTSPPTEENITEIGKRYPSFLLYENDHYGVVTENTLTLTRRSPEWRIKDEPFNPSRFILEPSLADAIHANLAAMKDFSKGSPKTFLLAETEEQLELMKASAAALEISVSGSKVIGSKEAEYVKREVEAAADAAKCQKSGLSFVHYASQSVTFALEVATTRQNLALFLSTPERAIEAANKTSVALRRGSPFADNTKVFFASVYGRWWRQPSELYRVIVQNLKTFGSQIDVLHSEINAVQGALSAVLANFFAESSFKLGGRYSAQDVLAEYPIISIPGMRRIGPLSMNECTNKADAMALDRECSCNKLFRQLTVAEVGEWLTMSPQNYFNDQHDAANKYKYTYEYRMKGCGVDYTVPKRSILAMLRSADVIGGIAGGGVLILISIGGLVFFYFFLGRSHWNAPKDSAKPFVVLFTDVESSTALWSRVPAAMSLSINVHHDLIRKQIKLHKGYEVKTIGDSFMVAFKEPENAVELAVGIQRSFYANEWPEDIDYTYRSLALERAGEAISLNPIFLDENIEDYKKLWCGIRVRVGVHYGFGNIKKNEVSNGYDYYGTVVDTAARVEGVGHGGQVLITEDVSTSLSESFLIDTIDAEVISLKEQCLKGIDYPIHLYQVMPNELIDRHFNPLRLDIERTVEVAQDDCDAEILASHSERDSFLGNVTNNSGKHSVPDSEGTKASGCTSFKSNLVSESVADELQAHYRNVFHSEDLLQFYNFLTFANVSSSLKHRENLILHWGKNWNVAVKKPNKSQADDILMYNSLHVLAKITASFSDNISSKKIQKAGSFFSNASGLRGSFTDSLLRPGSTIDIGCRRINSTEVMSLKRDSNGVCEDAQNSHSDSCFSPCGEILIPSILLNSGSEVIIPSHLSSQHDLRNSDLVVEDA